MASVFVRRDTGVLRKFVVSSGEACGLSTARMKGGVLETHSYFDGTGDSAPDRSVSWPARALPDDGLALQLRDFVRGDLPATVQVMPSLMTGKHPALKTHTLKVSRKAAPKITVPSGTYKGVEIRLQASPSSWIACTFEEAVPHRLLEMRRSDGTVYRLAKSERLAYWSLHNPGNESWIPRELR